jgi:hypothetical protein
MSLSTAAQTAAIPAAYFPVAANTAGTTIVTGSGVFYGFQGMAAGTSWVITVYDNTAASGNVLATFTNTANTFQGGLPTQGVVFKTGLTIVASGTAGTGNVMYQTFQ